MNAFVGVEMSRKSKDLITEAALILLKVLEMVVVLPGLMGLQSVQGTKNHCTRVTHKLFELEKEI